MSKKENQQTLPLYASEQQQQYKEKIISEVITKPTAELEDGKRKFNVSEKQWDWLVGMSERQQQHKEHRMLIKDLNSPKLSRKLFDWWVAHLKNLTGAPVKREVFENNGKISHNPEWIPVSFRKQHIIEHNLNVVLKHYNNGDLSSATISFKYYLEHHGSKLIQDHKFYKKNNFDKIVAELSEFYGSVLK